MNYLNKIELLFKPARDGVSLIRGNIHCRALCRPCPASASGRNGSQAIHGLACEQVEIGRQLALAEARRVFDMSAEALDLIRARCAGFGIDCDWRDGSPGVVTSAGKVRALLAGADHLAQAYRLKDALA